MKLLCWNIRGFGHLGRRRQLIDYLRQEEIDIVSLQETIRQDFTIQELQGLSPHPFCRAMVADDGALRGPPVGGSGGLVLG
ncbi:hypothetical protein CFC21_029793 [Triticum aestivum]|uniref:Endonuclease/exonuclease/phosphatase domain-containing protein n=2 Tax=Triticum aestivum TaxID=4565 RepID=A0A3B6DCS9_WHEAT|nr:hypothetical protein CFC21_029793 [Triticum aestivum]